MHSPLEIILTVVVLGFWFLFPIGMFIAIFRLDKNSDQLVQLGRYKQFRLLERPNHLDLEPKRGSSWRPYALKNRKLIRH